LVATRSREASDRRDGQDEIDRLAARLPATLSAQRDRAARAELDLHLRLLEKFDTIGSRDVFRGGPSFFCPCICLSL